MTKELFEKIFDNELLNDINQLAENNSLIKTEDLSVCKERIFRKYNNLKEDYKNNIFASAGITEDCLLDRHKIAACMNGAFLDVGIFNRTKLIENIRQNKALFETYFIYTNELIAFKAACEIVKYFMVYDYKDNLQAVDLIINNFPLLPESTKSKKCFIDNICFNLSQINQMGIEHYDYYSYAMFFFMLEQYFIENMRREFGIENNNQ